ncbi:MAG: hypothetical protein AABY40_03595 [Nanoarchaeota archaeon]
MRLNQILYCSMLFTACVRAEKANPVSQEEIQKIRSVDASIKTEDIQNIFAASAKVELEIT